MYNDGSIPAFSNLLYIAPLAYIVALETVERIRRGSVNPITVE